MGDTTTTAAPTSAPLLDLLPVGMAVLAADGTFRQVNARIVEMTGRPASEIIGRSVLDFTPPDDVPYIDDVLSAGRAYVGRLTGPMRVRFRHADGSLRWTEFWAHNHFGVPGIDGYLVSFSEESTDDRLSDAVKSIAASEPLHVTMRHITHAMSAHPMCSRAVVVLDRDGERQVIGDWPLDTYPFDPDDPAMPWGPALERGVARMYGDLSELPPALARAVEGAGIGSVWVRPLRGETSEVFGALVVWRSEVGTSTPNQERRMVEAASIATLAFDQHDYRERLERAAFVDPLTGLGNRAKLVASASSLTGSAVLYVDLDGFKEVNDRHGHAAGDAVLTLVGARLAATVRDVDMLVRIGGDEFVVICSTANDRAGAEKIAERIVRVISEPYTVDPDSYDQTRRRDGADSSSGQGRRVVIGASVGIAMRAPGRSLDDMIRDADRAMYRAKEHGKNRWAVADATL